jgi:PAS domain S-box-containing protein
VSSLVAGRHGASARSEPDIVRVLHLEDDPNDAELVKSALSEDGLACEITRVSTERHFREELQRSGFDLILADYKLPSFDGMAALALARSMTSDIPFILLSGTLGEERAVEALKTGATDYLLKDRLSRLGPSVRRALREAAQGREQRQAEAALRESQERLALALEASRIGVWSWDAEDDRFEGDGRMRELLGGAPGDSLSDLGSFLARVYEDDRDRVESTLLDAKSHESEFQFEFRLLAADDEIRYIATRGQFLPDRVGHPNRALSACWDVTDEKRKEQQRRLLSTVLESAVNAVLITDAEGRIRWVNAAFTALTGYSPEEVVGQNPRILKSGKHDEAFYQKMWDTISRCNTWHGQLVNRRKDSSLYTEETTILPVLGAYGEIASFVSIKRDITLEVDLTRQLHQAQRLEAVGQLAGGVAHDFNNILTIISGNAELALGDLTPQDPTSEALREIMEASRRAAALTRQLLAFSRKQILQPRVLDLNALVAGTEKMLRRLIGEDVVLRTRLQPNLSAIKADPGQLEQILMNLAVNARDAMPQGGELTFETENVDIHETYSGLGGVQVHSGGYARLTVTDTGQGIDEETQSRIFEPFFTTKEKDKGTGLGLSTVYGIVKQSGGYIWVESEPGKGTSFMVYFPQVDSTPEQLRPQTTASVTGGGETILVVEDDSKLLKLASSILKRGGYDVLTAGNGAEALQLVEAKPQTIHLLVTDVVMPGMSGRVLSERIRTVRPAIRVLYTSGYTDDAIVHHGVLHAGTNLLEKPYSQKTLLGEVRRVLDSDQG